MKALFSILFPSLILQTTMAVSTNDLKVQCKGVYQVLESEAIIDDDNLPRRAPAIHRTNDQVVITNIFGSGCHELPKFYGIDLKVGDKSVITGFTSRIASEAITAAATRPGQYFTFEFQQSFSFTSGEKLPYFPKVHSESGRFLNKYGSLDAQAKYGTLPIKDWTDSEKLAFSKVLDRDQINKDTLKKFRYGSVPFLSLYLQLEPESEQEAMEYAHDLLGIFRQTVKLGSTAFTTGRIGVELGQQLNSLLNTLGATQFSTQMEVLKRNPRLLDPQIVQWAGITNPQEAPELSEQDIDEWAEFALSKASQLASVVQVLPEALGKLVEYKDASKALLNAQNQRLLGYELSEEAEAQLTELTQISF